MLRKSALLALLTCIVTVQAPALAGQDSTPAPNMAASEAGQPVAAGVRNFAFVAAQASGWRQFARREAPMFKTGEALHFYAEPVNLGWSLRNQGYRFEIHVDVEIRTLGGQVLWGKRDYGRLAHDSQKAEPHTYVTGTVAVAGLPPGLYILSVRFRDPLNNRVAESDTGFGIMDSPRQIDV